MVPLDRALVSSYRQSIVNKSQIFTDILHLGKVRILSKVAAMNRSWAVVLMLWCCLLGMSSLCCAAVWRP